LGTTVHTLQAVEQQTGPLAAVAQKSLAQSSGATGLHAAPSGYPQCWFVLSHASMSFAHCVVVAHCV
jgi:hypothetical protein